MVLHADGMVNGAATLTIGTWLVAIRIMAGQLTVVLAVLEVVSTKEAVVVDTAVHQAAFIAAVVAEVVVCHLPSF